MVDDGKLRDYLKKVTADLRQTRQRLRQVEADRHEPIAVVSMACRFPGGVDSPEQLWEVAATGRDVMSDWPADRGWEAAGYYDPDPERSGKSYVREGGFLAGAAGFDAAFFGVSPREALAMDPQQRLLLEVSWEAVERAGLAPESLRGSGTGVFVGSSNQGYGAGVDGAADGVEGHLLTGSSSAVLSGRIAYTFGFEGPAVTIDTMCSSSLVATHLAIRALRQQECSMALVGGATVMASPRNFVEFSRQRGLAPDGRCKPFAEAADGTAWSEGIGVLLLERLSDAQRNGHRVLAVLRGSATNQDGASNGLTAPSGPAQQRVIREALRDAGLSPAEVDAVEAHGTGTELGDPIEAQALLATYGQHREGGRPLLLGSVKSNIGHSQAASGVAGIIKTVLSLQHATVPATLHVDTPTSHVDWTAGQVELVTENATWPATDAPRRAGVSSFGGSGTNAHVIVEEAPVPETAPDGLATEPGMLPWLLSARSAAALSAQAERLLEHVRARPELSPGDTAFAMATARDAMEHRAVLVGDRREELIAAAGVLADNGSDAALVTGVAGPAGRVALVFPGQGSQWVGMGRELLGSSPVFAARFAECGEALAPWVEWSLVAAVDDEGLLARVDVVQPVLFAVLVSLAAVWESFGVRPDAVVGHSQGEIAAAVVAGGLSLSDGARVVCARSRLIAKTLAGGGGMLSVALPEDEVRSRLAGFGAGSVSVAAVNGPSSVVVSGEPEALAGFAGSCEADGVRVRRIAVDYASHSEQVERLEADLLAVLAQITPRSSETGFFSTVTGDWIDTSELDADYWYRNLRHTVHFHSAITALAEQGYTGFVESSPHPVLTMSIQDTLDALEVDGALVTGTLRRDDGGLRRLYDSVGQAWALGYPVDWTPAFGDEPRRAPLPTYAFQHSHYWLDATPAAPGAVAEPADAGFWQAVDANDLASLADELEVTPAALAEVLPALSARRARQRQDSSLDRWRYGISWRPRPAAPRRALTGSWLLVSSEADADRAHTLRDGLTGAGVQVRELVLGPDEDLGRAALATRLHELLDTDPVTDVFSLLAADHRPDPGHTGLTIGMTATVGLFQALSDVGGTARLWLATRESMATGRGEKVDNPADAAFWGLGRVIALEHPDRWGGLVDLPADLDTATVAHLTGVLADPGTEDQLAVRGTGVLLRRLVRLPIGDRTPHRRWTPRGTALITGGTGGLGAHTARWLACGGAEHLVLTNRRGSAAPGADELAAELTALGARVTIVACDVTDLDALTELVEGLARDGDDIRTVVHTAGIGLLVPLADTSIEDFAEGVRAKMAGARNLDALFAEDTLDAFVLCSSVAGVWGSGDHGAYAASNAYVDALAENRRARGLAGTSIAWGIWSPDGGGMAVDKMQEQLRFRGITFMDPAIAVAGMQQALDRDEAFIAIADVDWDRFVPVFTATRDRPLLAEIPEVREILAADAASTAEEGTADGGFARRLRNLERAEQDWLLLDLVRSQVAAVLGHDGPEMVDTGRAFRELGFDSLLSVELRNRLNAATGLRLRSTIVFDHPTATVLAENLRTALLGDRADEPVLAPVSTRTEVDDDPIAIVSMACRFPGDVSTPEQLWDLVAAGVDAISTFPEDRGWNVEQLYDPDPDRPGTSYVRSGGFVTGAADFDPGFFGISPREALAMDPQQRMVMEVAWEALERAGIDPHTLRGSSTGVFLGAAYQGYGNDTPELPDGAEGHLVTGTATSVLSGRVSYTFGLEGPAITIDTGCSSALVSLHLAADAVRRGECTMALAGGVAVMYGPDGFIGFSRQRGLSLDGRCKAFGAGADGMALAEGAGLVLVERLSDARRNGHRVLGLLRGSAINQDGASNGLSAPSGLAQQRVIRQALANAGLEPSDVDVVEAHGTGTRLGDPIEAQALLATYGQGRPADRPLWLGSVKSNIGHTQAASGLAGLIKMLMALRNEQLPRTLHADQPTTHVDWTAGDVRLLTEQQPWQRDGRPRRAGISSFGVSGTNAHVVIEELPTEEDHPRTVVPAAVTTPPQADLTVPWPVSARTAPALRAQAAALLDRFAGTETSAVDIGFSLTTSRAALDRRAVVVAEGGQALRDGLGVLADGGSTPGLVTGIANVDGRITFLFPGQGSQWTGMAVELLESSEVFAARFAECTEAFAEHTDWPAREALSDEALLERVDVVQPLLYAVLVSLAEVWRAYGIEPQAVAGHSQGEIAAAVVAGGLSLADGARIVCLRSRLIAEVLAGDGGMVSLALSVDEARTRIDRFEERISIAAVNGPSAVVVSGEPSALAELLAECEAQEVRARRIPVDYASHSAQVERIEEQLVEALACLSPQSGTVPFFSTVTGDWLDTADLDAHYWYRNLRATVRFDTAIGALARQGFTGFVEISPHPVLTMAVQDGLDRAGALTPTAVVGTLRRGEGGIGRLLTSLAEAWVRGLPVDWAPVFASFDPHTVELPTYAFQRERYWLASETPARRSRSTASAEGGRRYQVDWQPVEAGTDLAATDLTGAWLLAVPAGDHAHEQLADALRGRGADLRVLVVDGSGDRAAVATRLREADTERRLTGVLSLLGAAEEPAGPDSATPVGLLATLTLLQALGDSGVPAALWTVTRGAVSTEPAEPLTAPLQALGWGLGRIAGQEHPERWGGMIDLPVEWDDHAAGLICAALSGVDGEDQLAVRGRGLLARRLVRAEPDAGTSEWTPSGTVLVTGGTGSFGARTARWLAAAGAEHLLLVSRRGPAAAGAGELAAELRELGAEVTVAACDVADREALSALLDSLPGELTAVVHTAGVVDDGVLATLTPERVAGVLRSKLDAAHNLHELTRHHELDAFVLFSSLAGTLGGPGQGSYAAANAYLDALAEHRRGLGLPATSLAWGALAGGGLVDEAAAARFRRSGMGLLEPEPALAELGRAVADGTAFLAVAEIDWERYGPSLTASRPNPALRGLPAAVPSVVTEEPGLVGELRALPASERSAWLLDSVRELAATALGYPDAAAIDADRAFRDLGFDSLTSVDLRNRIAESTGLRLPVTLVFDHPTATALARYLAAELLGAVADAPVPAATTSGPAVDDPIAIVGIGCRFPGGVESAEDLWRLVAEGRDVISPLPADRGWALDESYHPDPDHQGTFYTTGGGFLHEAGEFDAQFFGVSPREALAIDPQQRLLLETSWEAFETAGIDPGGARGERIGVFVGSNYHDYASRSGQTPDGLEGYLATGSAGSVASGRISYLFGFEGPALTVDTACSSSLVALHLAADAVRRGECTMALAGGVTVISTLDTFVEFSRQRALAPDGRCKAFGAGADGAGWAEGAGMLLVERLSDAHRNGHRVLAVVRGSAVNQDGASNGLTAPSGPAQQRVIRQALANAGLEPSDVDVVEAHGTGTSLGDPIEAGALLATYGRDRPADRPLWLGSVKSNIGHTQAASGLAGLIKMVMALRHEELPRTLHAEEPSPHIDWSSGSLRLLTEPVPWVEGVRPRRAAVSSFGISGTNVHVVLDRDGVAETAEPEAMGTALAGIAPAWPLSARSAAALRGQAGRLLHVVEQQPTLDPSDVAWSLATTRAEFDYRAVIPGGDLTALRALAEGETAPGLITGAAVSRKLAFLCTGQGAQRAGMGRDLHAVSPVFAAAFDEVCAHADGELARPLKQVVFAEAGSEDAELLDRTEYTQIGLFAVEVALFRLFEACGVEPDYLLGHSIGEITAAHLSGVLTLPDACRLVLARGRLMQALPPGGAMVSVLAAEAEVRALLAGHEHEVGIAAVNGPRSVVVSGAAYAVDRIGAQLAERGHKTKRLRVSHAFHSPLMDAMLAEFAEIAAGLDYSAPRIAVVSNLTGALADGPDLCTPEYWVRHVREAVRFGDGVRTLTGLGVTAFAELGPDGVLIALVQDDPDAISPDTVAVSALRGDRADRDAVTTALAELHVRGVALDREAGFGRPGALRVDLPTYAFQRERYWLEITRRAGGEAGLAPTGHPLLGSVVELAADGTMLYAGRISPQAQPWLAEHVVSGTILFPGTAFLELALAAGEPVGTGVIEELTLQAPLVLAADGAVRLQLVLAPADESGRRAITVHTRPDTGPGGWVQHAAGVLGATAGARGPASPAGADWPPAGAQSLDISDLYQQCAANGFDYGPVFQGLRAAWRLGEEVLAEVALPAGQEAAAGSFGVHPALLDAALHTIAFEDSDSGGRLPFSWSGITLHATGATALRIRLSPTGEDSVALVAADPAGRPVISVAGLRLRPLPAEQLLAARPAGADALYRLDWPVLPVAESVPGRWGLLEPAGDGLTGFHGSDQFADLASVVSAAARPDVVFADFSIAPPPGTTVPDAVRAITNRALRLVQDWLAEDSLTDTTLVVLTRGACAAAGAVADPVGASVHGLLRTAQSEHPDRFVLLDLEPDEYPIRVVADALASGEPQLAIRGTQVHVPRLVPAGAVDPAGAADSAAHRREWPRHGTTLITGATGTLGRVLARHLVTERGVRHLLLAGRRGPGAPGATKFVAELADLGCEVRLVACDAADRAALSSVLASVPEEHPLAAVVHVAGALDDGVLTALTPARMDTVLRPKVDAVVNLHELTVDLDLEAFVLYSSLAGTLGGTGQGNYASANAFLDAFAGQRHALGLPAQSLVWGLWAEASGMTGKLDPADLARMARGGLAPLVTAEAFELFDLATARDEPVLVPSRLVTGALADGPVPPMLRALAPPRLRRAGPAPETELAERLAPLTAEERYELLADLVQVEAAQVLGIADPETIDTDRGFLDLGFDSLTAVELRNRLTSATGLRLPATLLFDYPTPAALAGHLRAETAQEAGDGLADALGGVAAIERALPGIAGSEPERVALTDRLRRLLSALDEMSPGTDQVDPKIDAASDDEIFDLIDNELGIS
ncbi:polyketide synthase family protein [Actinoalloteichus sp. GBA129-24]|nr:type I polyketide synthase [Actinoalloteichus sp. GBA129-24]APU21398.1 polyketide synthase family protein [Actinoalloteichus sp. GBA129-24]